MSDTRLEVETSPARKTERAIQTTQFEYPIAATLNKNDMCNFMEDTGVVPSLRPASAEDALFVGNALIEVGVPIIEISMNGPDAIDVISHLAKHAPTLIVGGGSVRNADTARRCLDAGARFLCTDGLIPGVMEFAAKEKLAVIAGALTLTEVITSWDSGADFVKVVPCHAVGGHNYIRTLKTAVPQARLMAAGGVNQITALNYVIAGVAALSVSSEMIPADAITLRQARRIQELARRFLAAVDKGRA